MYEMPSDIRLMPGDDVDVIALTPAAPAPRTMLMDATSDSPCRYTPPTLGILLDM